MAGIKVIHLSNVGISEEKFVAIACDEGSFLLDKLDKLNVSTTIRVDMQAYIARRDFVPVMTFTGRVIIIPIGTLKKLLPTIRHDLWDTAGQEDTAHV